MSFQEEHSPIQPPSSPTLKEAINSSVDNLNDDTRRPLLFLFDTETTGLNIYEDHIVEIAAKVTGVPLSIVTQPSYSSLVHTPRNIPSKGRQHIHVYTYNILVYIHVYT